MTVQNLNQEQIDFISGPKLLPTISRTDSDATETVNIPQSEEATKEQSTVSLPQHMPEAINSSTTQNAATPSTSNKEADINMESPIDSGHDDTRTKIERPKRTTVKRDGIHGGYRLVSTYYLPDSRGGGGYSGVKTENTQSAKKWHNFNLGGGCTLESKLKILKVPRIFRSKLWSSQIWSSFYFGGGGSISE